jgi:hypothetical protein
MRNGSQKKQRKRHRHYHRKILSLLLRFLQPLLERLEKTVRGSPVFDANKELETLGLLESSKDDVLRLLYLGLEIVVEGKIPGSIRGGKEVSGWPREIDEEHGKVVDLHQ